MVYQDGLPFGSCTKVCDWETSKNVLGQDMTTAQLACLVVALLLIGPLNTCDAGKVNTIRYYTLCMCVSNE